ncbi:MAG: nuclear transport factor 2 family protein [Planctomycetota bacterium]
MRSITNPALLVGVALPLLGGCRTAGTIEEANGALDAWHLAASRADEDAYFGAMTADAVFLGTDASERWTKRDFRDWSEPYFDRDEAWTYTPRERFVMLGDDARFAWFDELLEQRRYGTARGTGVLLWDKNAARWKIAHYSLTFPIPNAIAEDVTRQIIEHERTREDPED